MKSILDEFERVKRIKEIHDGPSSERFRRECGLYYELENLFNRNHLTVWQMETVDRLFRSYLEIEEFGSPKKLAKENVVLSERTVFLQREIEGVAEAFGN